MDYSEIREKLLAILQDLHDDVDYESEDELVDVGVIDSMDIVTLITEIKSELDVAIPAQYIVPDYFNSLDALTDLVARLEEEI